MVDPLAFLPGDIPDDIIGLADAALSTTSYSSDPLDQTIACARAIMAERERLTDPAFLQRCILNTGLVGKEAVDEAVLAERERCEVLLSDPNAVHANMLRGTIAKPSIEQIIHLYGAESLATALRKGDA